MKLNDILLCTVSVLSSMINRYVISLLIFDQDLLIRFVSLVIVMVNFFIENLDFTNFLLFLYSKALLHTFGDVRMT